MPKIASFVRPHLGGTFTLFKHLRQGLSPHGITLDWVSLARMPAPASMLGGREAETGFFVEVDGSAPERDQAGALVRALERRGYDGVVVNVLADRVETNVARYLPDDMLRLMIVHNITPGTYAAARSIRDSVHATVGVSSRCSFDLVERHGFSPDRTWTIPNAVDVDAIGAVARPPRPPGALRLLYLGRVEDASKGVLWLPRIMSMLAANHSLTIAGDGPDLGRLKAGLARFGDRVFLLGPVSPGDVARVVNMHDVLVMPSRFEGFGLTIVEAMATGCVPVVARIAGVTDTVVEDGSSGLLFPVGDWREAARLIDMLHSQPALLDRLAAQARRRARSAFRIETMARSYARLIGELRASPPAIAPALPIDQWSLPGGLRPGLRTYLPGPLKNWLRVARERLRPSGWKNGRSHEIRPLG